MAISTSKPTTAGAAPTDASPSSTPRPRPDLTGLPDLITLAHLGQGEGRTTAPRWIRETYRRHTNTLGAQWSDAGLVRALTAFATATGLTSLHGIDQ